MKEQEKEKIEKMEKVVLEVERSPAIKEFREAEARELLAKRTGAVECREQLKLEAECLVSAQDEIDGLVEKVAAMDAERQDLMSSINEKRSALMQEKSGIEGEIRRHEMILYESYSPAIDEAILFFRDKLDFFRLPERISSNKVSAKRNILQWKKEAITETNLQAVHDAIFYCQAALKELERMKLTPALDTEKIERMKAGIPDIDVFAEFQHERPMEKLNTDARSMLPSDSEVVWSLKNLDEKFKQIIMGRV